MNDEGVNFAPDDHDADEPAEDELWGGLALPKQSAATGGSDD